MKVFCNDRDMFARGKENGRKMACLNRQKKTIKEPHGISSTGSVSLQVSVGPAGHKNLPVLKCQSPFVCIVSHLECLGKS